MTALIASKLAYCGTTPGQTYTYDYGVAAAFALQRLTKVAEAQPTHRRSRMILGQSHCRQQRNRASSYPFITATILSPRSHRSSTRCSNHLNMTRSACFQLERRPLSRPSPLLRIFYGCMLLETAAGYICLQSTCSLHSAFPPGHCPDILCMGLSAPRTMGRLKPCTITQCLELRI